MLSQVDEELIILQAIDEVANNQENFPAYEKTVTLPSKILVKRNILVELYAGNYNIEDGLVNGADGAIRSYSYGKKEMDVIWIEFVDPNVGKMQREKFHELYNDNFSPSWTPIFRVAKPLPCARGNTQTTIRKQFPIQLACVRTIHRAQGLTLDRLAFNPINIRAHGLVYTTLSRVKSMDSLFLVHKLSQQNFSVNKKLTTEMK